MALKPGNVIQAKTGTIERTDTTAKQLFTLPPNAVIIGIRAFGPVSENASTLTMAAQPTDSTTATTFATIDGTACAAGENDAATLAGAAFTRQAKSVYVTGKWEEATTNTSTSGGPYSVVVEYL
ncbi:MAG: hypothetical protein JZU65_05605 [Chlorobium sp.]|nr:hypothetical protein [Chlorobium sp.]